MQEDFFYKSNRFLDKASAKAFKRKKDRAGVSNKRELTNSFSFKGKDTYPKSSTIYFFIIIYPPCILLS